MYEGEYDENKTYEQYGASPSPDYPSEIVTVGSNVNLLTYPYPDTTKTVSGITFTDVGDGTVIANGTATGTVYFNLGRPTLNKGEYYLSGIPFGGSSKTYEIKFGTHNYYSGGTFEVTESSFIPRESYIKINKDNTVNDLVFKPKLEEGIVATPYSTYGMGNVEIDAVNRNFLYYTNKNQTIKGIDYTINQDKSIKVKGTATEYSDFYLRGTATQYEDIGFVGTFKISGCNSGNSNKYMLYVVKKDRFGRLKYYQNVAGNTKLIISEGDTLRIFIRVLTGITVDDVIYPMLRVFTDTDNSYIEAKKQTAIMPIQQEMLEGDYVADVEHHEWGEYMLTGNETNISISGSVNGITQFNINKIVYKNPNTEEITARSNYFLGVKWDKSWTIDNCICNTTDGYSIRIMTSEYTTVEDFKAGLKSKYDAGTPVIIYYKLAKPLNLELTAEQKAIRDTKLYTYKNITNIDVSDELASIDVTYKKDLETMFNNIIKQIPSSTSDTSET